MTKCMGVSLQFLTLYHKHSEDILDQVITRGRQECTVTLHQPNKRVSIEGEGENRKVYELVYDSCHVISGCFHR